MNLSAFTVGWKSASESQQIPPLFQVWRSEIRDLSGAQLTGAATFLIPKVWGTQCQWSHEHPGSRTVPCTLTPRKHPCSSCMPAPRSDWSVFLGLVALRHETQAEISEGGRMTRIKRGNIRGLLDKKGFLEDLQVFLPILILSAQFLLHIWLQFPPSSPLS